MATRTKELRDIREGFHVFKRGIDAAIACKGSDVHISHSQWFVLDLIGREKRVSIKEISATLGISSSAATQLVNEPVKDGYVLKRSDKKDGRVTVVAISPKATAALAKLRTHVLRGMAKV